jgi:hypothetical protein
MERLYLTLLKYSVTTWSKNWTTKSWSPFVQIYLYKNIYFTYIKIFIYWYKRILYLLSYKNIDFDVKLNICSYKKYIGQYNKEFFGSEEEVVLFVEIKNIPLLKVKIFELVLENYYLTSNTEIQDDINLDGLIACYE